MPDSTGLTVLQSLRERVELRGVTTATQSELSTPILRGNIECPLCARTHLFACRDSLQIDSRPMPPWRLIYFNCMN
jgi:hypothetical protein